MVNCPSCKREFPVANIWAEAIQARELENRKDLGDYIIFMCRLCKLFLDIKEKSSTGKIDRKNEPNTKLRTIAIKTSWE